MESRKGLTDWEASVAGTCLVGGAQSKARKDGRGLGPGGRSYEGAGTRPLQVGGAWAGLVCAGQRLLGLELQQVCPTSGPHAHPRLRL